MKKIKLHPSGKEIEVSSSDTVLSALEKQGLFLPNNCRAGACGECKLKVKSGTIDQGLVLDMALSKAEREQGMGLMCMAKITSDILEIEWNDDLKPKLFKAFENMPYVITEKSQLTSKIVKLRMRGIGQPLRFWPGQFINLQDNDMKLPKRSYSIVNIPNDEGELILYITKVLEGKLSTWIHDDLQIGDRVKVSGPHGTFIGDPQADTPVLCLAAGSGLAPIASLASGALLRGGFRNPATILFSCKTKNDLIDYGHFRYLETKYRNFKFKFTLTGEGEHDLKGRIPKILPSMYPDLSGYSVYIAGSPEFVEECEKVAVSLGAKEDLIHKEGFFPQ